MAVNQAARDAYVRHQLKKAEVEDLRRRLELGEAELAKLFTAYMQATNDPKNWK